MAAPTVIASAQLDLVQAREQAERGGLFTSLRHIYAAFPETECPGCARCCFESPGVFFTEHLHLVDLLARLPRESREARLRRALAELLFSWIDPDRTCLFLDSSRCLVYPHRPLACRLFGLVAPADREAAEVEARRSAREEAQRLARLGIAVPPEVAGRVLVSCDRIREQGGRPVRPIDAEALAARVARLDEALLPRRVVMAEFCFRSLPDRLGEAWFGAEVDRLRLDLLRRAQHGERGEDLANEVRERLPADLLG